MFSLAFVQNWVRTLLETSQQCTETSTVHVFIDFGEFGLGGVSEVPVIDLFHLSCMCR